MQNIKLFSRLFSRLFSKSLLSIITAFIVFSVGLQASPVQAFGVSGVAILLTKKINASSKFTNKFTNINSLNYSLQTKTSNNPITKISHTSPLQQISQGISSDSPENLLSFDIPKIGLYNVGLAKSSVTNLDDLDQKMLKNPILDTLTSEPCLARSSTYIMGHSEPPTKSRSSQRNTQPAVRIFSDLNKLKPNDKIDMTNSQGVRCVYNIVGSEIVSTGPNNGVSTETFNNLYFPEVKNNSILKIQTCVKGSTTKRLIYTAIME